jgi:hypothetical protein
MAEIALAVILPRVQVHFDLTSKVVGLLSASTMAGVRSVSSFVRHVDMYIDQSDDDWRRRLGSHFGYYGSSPPFQLDPLLDSGLWNWC